MTALYIVAAVLALLPAINTLANLLSLCKPPVRAGNPRVAVLIPARNEEKSIGECVDAALRSCFADVEVIVLDDSSSDRTWEIVEQRRALDTRVRIAKAPSLPPGMKGKPHACALLAQMTDRPYLLFVDADVRLAPTAAARLIPPSGIDLVSGVPRQVVRGVVETSVIPIINSLILGYLPVGLMRWRSTQESLAIACGQLMMVRADAYRRCGGHMAIAYLMHDGMQLARLFRRHGFRTDLIAAATLAHCRMYESAAAVFEGFGKNATEGMARPVALPVWTVLLGGGHLLPLVLTAVCLRRGHPWPIAGVVMLCATVVLVIARMGQKIACREPVWAVPLHPLGILLTLSIQWHALYSYIRGRPVTWRERVYAPTL